MTQSPSPDDYGRSPDLGGSTPSGDYGQNYASGQQCSGHVPAVPPTYGTIGLYGDPADSAPHDDPPGPTPVPPQSAQPTPQGFGDVFAPPSQAATYQPQSYQPPTQQPSAPVQAPLYPSQGYQPPAPTQPPSGFDVPGQQDSLAPMQVPPQTTYGQPAPPNSQGMPAGPQPGHYPQPSLPTPQQSYTPQEDFTSSPPGQFPQSAQPQRPAAPQHGDFSAPPAASTHGTQTPASTEPWYHHLPDEEDGFSEPTTYALPQVQSAETLAGVNVVPPPQQYATPLWAPPIVKKAFPIVESIVAGLSLLGIMALFGMYFTRWGFGLTTFVTLFAIPSLLAIIYTLHLIDRWEGESWKSRLLSLGWGAGIATAVSLFFNGAGSTIAYYVTGSEDIAQGFGTAVVAPVVEETFKGACVAFIVLARRHHLQSALDGVVHGGLVGAGFAFVENILYFARGFEQGGEFGYLLHIVFLRGVMSPFLHPMATSLTGLAIAWSVTRMRRRHSWTWMGLIGLFAAMTLHGLWNFSALFGQGVFYSVYAFVMFPLFIAWLVLLFVASSREAKEIAQGLQPYVATGWMLPSEVTMATHGPSRSRAMQWARRGGPHAKKAMKKFLRSVCILGLDQQLMARTGPDQKRIDYDRDLLAEISTARNTFLSAHGISI
ncbi:MAG: PrsW family glutamic-type intramembrane protease [Actinomycetaceae bacterium]|nr:PrsW family glutamic-type intramembrane protease [Actinomycetaceae bacterium]